MKPALVVLTIALLFSVPDSTAFAANAAVPLKPIRREVIINRTNSACESQQVQKPCILPNPRDPARLLMFYSGVPATNRNLCFIGKAWALKSGPFAWHQDEHNPVFKTALTAIGTPGASRANAWSSRCRAAKAFSSPASQQRKARGADCSRNRPVRRKRCSAQFSKRFAKMAIGQVQTGC
jgi:hypothetical protein